MREPALSGRQKGWVWRRTSEGHWKVRTSPTVQFEYREVFFLTVLHQQCLIKCLRGVSTFLWKNFHNFACFPLLLCHSCSPRSARQGSAHNILRGWAESEEILIRDPKIGPNTGIVTETALYDSTTGTGKARSARWGCHCRQSRIPGSPHPARIPGPHTAIGNCVDYH
jgi:hypothetical protein